MNEFIKKPRNKASYRNSSPIYGVGINDADYMINYKTDEGKTIVCPIYRRWTSFFTRCYSLKLHERQPTYIGCTVSDEWLTFSNFAGWMEPQEHEGLHLDKDILLPNNKIYSADFCVFIPQYLNAFMTSRGNDRGEFPVGVSFNKQGRKYEAYCKDGKGNKIHLGSYPTPELAFQAYVIKKVELYDIYIAEQTDPRIAHGLELHKQILIYEQKHYRYR